MNYRTLFFSLLLCCIQFSSYAQVTVTNLKCEYLEDPVGLDETRPRFTWQMESSEPGSYQSAYELVVGTMEAEVASGRGDVWKSGAVESSLIPAVYAGEELEPFTRYFWSVRVRDEGQQWSDWASPRFFETGMMGQFRWKGKWITDTYDFNVKPAAYFRRVFKAGKTIESARAYIAVAGLYELTINGERVGDHRLDPNYTRFDRRTLYVTYDVTDHLQPGDNAVGVLLGNGWYNHQSTAVWYFDQAPWRARPKFCLDLHVTYTDGTKEIIVTDGRWRTSPSPVIFNSIYTAEHYDARKEQPGWDTPGFEAEGWSNIQLTGAPSNNIVAQALRPIRNVKEYRPVSLTRIDDRTWLYDFGQNMSGVTRVKVNGPEGTTVRLKHVERLDSNGRADMSNIDIHYRPTDDSDPFQTDILILSGKKEDEFMPRFNYKGFQYVEVTADQPLELSEESLTAYFMHSDVPPIGKIASSNNTLDKIWRASNASYLSNLFGYPTDCPHREKNGWTGDAHNASEMGLYNFDGITVYEKWLADHRDEQQSNGVLPAIIPTSGWGYHWANGPDWTSTIAIIPWNVYLFYGDTRLLDLCYDNIKRYVDYIDEQYPTGIANWGLGDWLPVKSVAPMAYTSSTYFYIDALILAKTAKLFGKTADFERYSALAEKIKAAINEKYLDYETGIYGSGLQTELSVALHWGVVPDELRGKVADNLARRVEQDDKHIDVGSLGCKTILNALSDNGYAQLAYEVASQETYPSWGWWIVNGSTTFHENWPVDAGTGDSSMNHIMFGEINAWYYKALGGIFPDEEQPGFKHIILKPHFVTGLSHFEASHEGPYGFIVSSWKRKGKVITYNVTVPTNSTATLYLSGKRIRENNQSLEKNPMIGVEESGQNQYRLKLQSGSYTFSITV